MKAEIKREFSTVFKTDRFYVYYDNHRAPEGFQTQELAMKEIKEMKIAIEKKKESKTVYTEEF